MQSGKMTLTAGLLFLGAACSPSKAEETHINQACAPAPRMLEVSPGANNLYDALKAKEVIMTFDDGPHRHRTQEILDILDTECVSATFFLLGNNAKKHPELVREIAARGHQIGAHSWAHANLTEMSLEDARKDIARGAEAIEAALGEGSKVKLFRYPFIAYNDNLQKLIANMGLGDVTVHVDGADWENIGPDQISANILTKLEERGGKGVILLHPSFNHSNDAARQIIRTLKADGYAFLTVTPAQ